MPMSSRYYDVGTDFYHLVLRYLYVDVTRCLFAVISPMSNYIVLSSLSGCSRLYCIVHGWMTIVCVTSTLRE